MTFPDSSFDGNQALCPRLVAPCQRKQIPPVVFPGKKMKIMDWNFGIGAAIGFLLTVFFCFKSGWVIHKGREEMPSKVNLLRHFYILSPERDTECISPVKSKEQGKPRLAYNDVWSFPPNIGLSDNKFTGPIWPSFGKLKNLHVEFGRTNLSRSIPDSISGMTSLEVLGLSPNNISGDTPHSLVHLSFLSVFNVSYNRLYGETPSEGQFMTFPEASFEGNEALCPRLLAPRQTK
ncbi:hypothetical protein Golob_026994 [Gossypium lobatum]|uniref:Uncharacterized protein n=1 Tax=Gossypium lobatum TaxID=34289 RepID=A0A7J8LX45_9ROSI|nr:hypothetical protein [Gossypium lobatum]